MRRARARIASAVPVMAVSPVGRQRRQVSTICAVVLWRSRAARSSGQVVASATSCRSVCGQVVAAESFAGDAQGVEVVGLLAHPARWAARVVDLADVLTVGEEP